MKKIIVILFAFVLLINCEKETITKDSTTTETRTKPTQIERLTIEHLDDEVVFNEVSSKFGLKELISPNPSLKLKNGKKKYDFTINTDLIKKITTDSVISYTMLIERGKKRKKDSFENLVIEKRKDSISGYFIKYSMDKPFLEKNQKENISGTISVSPHEGNIEELIKKIKDIRKNINDEDCEVIEVFVETSCPCAGHWPGESCQCDVQPDTDRYVFDPCEGGGNDMNFQDGATYYSDGGSSGGGGSVSATVIPNEELQTLEKTFLSTLNSAERNFYLNNLVVKEQIRAYLAVNDYSGESKNLAKDIVNAGADGTLISVAPFFKYPDGSNYASLYPEFTFLLESYIPSLKDNALLLNTISDLTNVSTSDIEKHLEWGEGPEIHIQDLGPGMDIKGKFNPSEPNKIFIDLDLVNHLENYAIVNGETNELGAIRALIVFSVCLHELVHFEDFGFDELMTNSVELGLLFENLFNNGYYEFDENNEVVKIRYQ